MTEADGRTRDVVIVGTGPAGLTAATYAARRGLDTLLFEKDSLGGELVNRDDVRGYPGFPDGVSGPELRSKLVDGLDRYDVDVVLTEVETVEPGDPHVLRTDSGEYRGDAIVVATGGRPRPLGVPGEEQYDGRGIFHCAKCDGPLYRDDRVAIAGGNNHAVIDALFLADIASEVLVIESGSALSADDHLRAEAESVSNLTVETETEVASVSGRDGVLDSIALRDVRAGTERDVSVDGLYVSVGLRPNTEFLEGTVGLDDDGWVEVDGTLETSVDGIFAAGDVREHSPREVAAAVGDGVAVISAIPRD